MGAGLLAHGYAWALLTVFVGGFLTSLTPCVYPLIPITVSVFGARKDQTGRGRALLLAACYVGGIAFMYAGLGLFSALAGRAFGTFMANPLVMVPIALLFIAMAASMFGAFELRLPSGLQGRLSSVGGSGFLGAFLMGLVGGIIAAPCTGPVLASILAFVATTRSVGLGVGLLVSYALGMGVLFFALAAFAVRLPRSGAWMEAVKSVFGVVMLLGALYFLRNVSPALRELGRPELWFLLASIGVAVVGVIAGGVHLSFHGTMGARLRKGAGVAALVVGGFGCLGWALAPPPSRPLLWVKGADEALATAKVGHKPVLLDFSADWCLPCRELELKTFSDARVSNALADRFTLGKVDCTTDDDERVVKAKEKWGAATLPTLIVVTPDGKVAHKIDHVVGPDELLKLLDDAT